MFCQNCGAQLPENAKFCASCGAPNGLYQSSGQPTLQPAYTVPQPVQTSAAQPQQASTEMLMNEYDKAAEPQPAAQQPSYSQTEPQPVRYTAEPVPAAAPKKRSKLIPGLCIAAGAVVVLGGAGAVVYNLNKANITRMMMGDANYAYSVAMQAASRVNVPTDTIDVAVRSVVKAGVNTSTTENVMDIAADAANGDLSYDDVVSAGNSGTVSESSLASIGTAMEFGAAYISELTGMSGAEVSMSGSLELSDSVKELILGSANGADGAVLDDIISGLNSTDLTIAEKDSGDAYEYALKLRSGEDSIVDAQMRYEQDGTLTLVFPGITETGITAKLPEHTAEEDKPQLPKYDVKKLYSKISSGIQEKFKDYDIQCEPGETIVGGLKFSGLSVEIRLSGDDIVEIIEVVADALEDDDELQEYIDALGSSTDLDDIVSSMRASADSLKNSVDLAAQLTFYVNNDNTLAGGRLLVTVGKGDSAELAALAGGNDADVIFSINGDEYLAIRSRGTSATAGRVEFDLTGMMNAAMLLRSEQDRVDTAKYSLYMDYTNAGVMELFGIPTPTGEYVLSLSSDVAELISNGDEQLMQTIEQSSITISQMPYGKGVECKFGIDISGYGKGEFVVSLDEPKGEVAPKPGSSYKFIDVENGSEEDVSKLGEDFMKHVTNLAENNKLISALYQISNSNMS